MKRLISSLVIVIIATVVIAQTPQSFKYQAVVRDNSGSVVAEQAVGFKVEILKGSTGGEAIYSETHNKETNQFGLVNLEIGNGTTGDDFSAITWGSDDYFLRISIDITGGVNYELTGTSQLLSVPYALHANVADSVTKESQTLALDGNTLSISSGNSVTLPSGGTSEISGNYMVSFTGDISDAEAAEKIANEVGPNTKYIWIMNTTQLTTMDISGCSDLEELYVLENSSLTSLAYNDLQNCREFYIYDSPALSNLSFNSLLHSKELSISYCENLQNIDLNSLNSSTYIELSGLDISTFTLPNLSLLQEIYINFCENLSIIDISNLSNSSFYLNFSYNALTSDAVNDILAHSVSLLPNLSGNIRLNNQTPPAPPTGQGITDKETLISNGVSVLTD